MNSHISPQLCQVSPSCPKCPVGKTENKKIRYKEIRRYIKWRETYVKTYQHTTNKYELAHRAVA